MTRREDIDDDAVLRRAGRVWFRAGVRRRDRRRLRADLAAELAAAGEFGAHDLVLGDDPRTVAREWARAQGVTDRRLRLAAFVLPAILASVLASGAVLAMLAAAFNTVGGIGLHVPGPVGMLTVYGASIVLSCGAIALVSGSILRLLGDETARATVRALIIALPVGAAVAIGGGVSVAAAQGFGTDARTFGSVIGLVLVVVAGAMSSARWFAVRPRRGRSLSS